MVFFLCLATSSSSEDLAVRAYFRNWCDNDIFGIYDSDDVDVG